MIDLHILMSRQHPDPDLGMTVDKALAHGKSVEVMHQNNIAVLKCTQNTLYLIVIYPQASGL